MALGQLFYSLGPATLNDLFANVFLLVKGTQKRVLSQMDLRPDLEVVDFNLSS